MDARRVAFTCDNGGRITALLRDAHGLLGEDVLGKPFPSLLAATTRRKGFHMLDQLRHDGAIFGWALDVQSGDEVVTLHFAGAYRADETLLVACDQSTELSRFNEELVKLNNEHVSELRRVIKDRATARPGPEGDLLEQLMELNNENQSLQRELARRNAELTRVSADRSLLIGMVAHDLRSPLMVLRFYAEELAAHGFEPEERREVAQELIRAGEQMFGIIDETLDWAALETAEPRLKLEDADPAALIAEVVQVARIAAGRRDVDLVSLGHPDAVRLRTDRVKLRQILDNLVSNALRVSPAGTRVELRLEADAHRVALVVTDQGPGISPEAQQAIFEPFRGAHSEDGDGRGFGLAIVRRLVEVLGGKIEVHSEAGKGTEFRVGFPVEENPAAAPDSTS